jgi:hypothetical protein
LKIPQVRTTSSPTDQYFEAQEVEENFEVRDYMPFEEQQ